MMLPELPLHIITRRSNATLPACNEIAIYPNVGMHSRIIYSTRTSLYRLDESYRSFLTPPLKRISIVSRLDFLRIKNFICCKFYSRREFNWISGIIKFRFMNYQHFVGDNEKGITGILQGNGKLLAKILLFLVKLLELHLIHGI